MSNNPAPRAALAREGGTVVRPGLRRGDESDPPATLRPAPVPANPTDVFFGTGEPAASVRPVHEVEKPKPAKKDKKHKHAAKAKHDDETVEVRVELSKPVRRALKSAAADRDTTPEALAALVLTAWLDR